MLRVSKIWASLLIWPHLDAVLVIELLSLRCKLNHFFLLCFVMLMPRAANRILPLPSVSLLVLLMEGDRKAGCRRRISSFCFLPVYLCITHSCFFTPCRIGCCSSWSVIPEPAISYVLRNTSSSPQHLLLRRLVLSSKLEALITPACSLHA